MLGEAGGMAWAQGISWMGRSGDSLGHRSIGEFRGGSRL